MIMTSTESPDPAAAGDERLAVLGYLAVPVLGPCVPLVIYLLRKRRSGYLRRHSAQALNLSVTGLLYGLCVLIIAGTLALDSVTVALALAVPVAAVLWLVVVGYVISAGSVANHGGYRRIPGWLCATLVR
jgi:uncharacterized protein